MKEITGTIYEAKDGEKFLTKKACTIHEQVMVRNQLESYLFELHGDNDYSMESVARAIVEQWDKVKEIVEQN